MHNLSKLSLSPPRRPSPLRPSPLRPASTVSGARRPPSRLSNVMFPKEEKPPLLDTVLNNPPPSASKDTTSSDDEAPNPSTPTITQGAISQSTSTLLTRLRNTGTSSSRVISNVPSPPPPSPTASPIARHSKSTPEVTGFKTPPISSPPLLQEQTSSPTPLTTETISATNYALLLHPKT